MFYQYNNGTAEYKSTVAESSKNISDNSNNFNNQKIERKIFSENFQIIKENEKTILNIVFPKKSTIYLTILIILFIGILYFGAWIFKILEQENEIVNREKFKLFRQTFLNNHNCVSNSELEKVILTIENIKDMGLSAKNNASEDNWSMSTAVFFVTTLVTTIGYGNDKPLTIWGKIFCMTFVVFGLPLLMILATAVTERMLILIDLVFSAVCYKYKWKITEDRYREIEIIVCFFILILGFILIPACAFVKLEEGRWSYLDSIYYCVISLTTIGLGDFVPGNNADKSKKDLLKILATVYLFSGLLWASFCIQIFRNYHKWNFAAKFIYLGSNHLNFKYTNFANVSTNESDHVVLENHNEGLISNIKTVREDFIETNNKSYS